MRLQVELAGIRVGAAVDSAGEVLASGDVQQAEDVIGRDDEIDAMVVSLTERCYDLLRRESPVAADLRFCVSVLRVLEELERIGDLALRVVKRAPDVPALASHGLLPPLLSMSDQARHLYQVTLGAWSAQDADALGGVGLEHRRLDEDYARLVDAIAALEGPGVGEVVIAAVICGRALERIADHSVIIGARLCYLLTGNPAYLAAEVR